MIAAWPVRQSAAFPLRDCFIDTVWGARVAQTRWSLIVAAMSRICVVAPNPDPVRYLCQPFWIRGCYAWLAAKGLGTHWCRRQVAVAVAYMCMRYFPRPRIWPLNVVDVSRGRMRNVHR